MEKPKPIFVIGKHRSGTTGLANHLCKHPKVAGVQHRKHWGIHESGYFAYVEGRYGPLSHWPNYREFVEVMSASDYFSLAGIDKEYMLSLWPTTYIGFFGSTMSRFAQRKDATYWLEKSPAHTKEALRLAKEYPRAKFVAIMRDVADVVASSLSHFDEGQAPDYGPVERAVALIRVVLGWVYSNESIRVLQRQHPHRVKVVTYDAFLERKRSLLKDVCAFLEIDYSEDMCVLPYARNSSFTDQKARAQSITAREKECARAVASVLRGIPYPVYQVLDLLYTRYRTRIPLPDWYFRLSDRGVEFDSEVAPGN